MKLKKKSAFILLDHDYSLCGFDGAAIDHVLEDGLDQYIFSLDRASAIRNALLYFSG